MRLAAAALLLGMAMTVSAPAAADDVADIRAARAAYNAAIAAHDVAGVRAAFINGYTGIAGSGGEVISGATAMVDYFATAFRNAEFAGFVRTPEVITIAATRDRAMERGRWSGGSHTSTLSGEYLAVWVPTAKGWRLRSESFVTLGQSAGE